ncbi:hypothetical protein CDQ84_07805 [Clostridium thermosuccinogenes]|jgi:putative endonuclease|uniref:UPF0102 protein CDQ84_07805 n=1 Tax=Clostridium thermosuccinogenes TaxID=84032 RepID=A0A2K2FLU3_9CLOT|nr:YraN family protein [Pseudoclostridium thermosuccinogenes]AUS96476.1 hypothetical protein CDO33_08550 [Pseudoclostridium thermosuccinogenes]PNT92861.1 hypothetical protein CDQ83_04690 [Pseudoclostridium thermosuccinogenes]PNT97751.1 hypothetical protein CDQ85_07305 [Pseudoclostridium thermosuccinogenes]PNT99742.1 hypothetical protein CDQ84_07805 [Pseudoclostridium thermosuccinogenes]
MDGRNKRKLGSFGEEIAADFLIKSNYKIVNRNFRIGKLGEIDIIAWDGEYICFIEVKTRRSFLYGTPSEAVSKSKQAVIRNLAGIYLDRYGLNDSKARFDVIEIIYRDKADYDLNIIKNAF